MKTSICELLRERMMAYIEARDESVRWLSQRVGLPYSSVYRIISREAHNCTFRNAYQILKVVAPDEAKAILVEHFPVFAPLVDQDPGFIQNESKAEKALELVLESPALYSVWMAAATKVGTSRSYIKEHFGLTGLNALEYLLEQEVLCEKRDGQIFYIYNETHATNANLAKQMARYNLDILNADDEYSAVISRVEGYNQRGLDEVKKLMKETWQKLSALTLDPANQGDHKLFISLLFGKQSIQFDATEKGGLI